MKALAAAGLLALTGCPYDQLAADSTPADGGIWYGDPNDGGVFLPQDPEAGAANVGYLTKAPSIEKLCMLSTSDFAGIDDHHGPKKLGTWIGDVESPLFFGAPSPNAEQIGTEDAQLSYHWPGGGIFLSFRWVQAFPKLRTGIPWPKGFFLGEIQMEGVPAFQDCWREPLGFPGAVPCTECQTAGISFHFCDYYPCTAKEIQQIKMDNGEK